MTKWDQPLSRVKSKEWESTWEISFLVSGGGVKSLDQTVLILGVSQANSGDGEITQPIKR